jgi:hypothetical protein
MRDNRSEIKNVRPLRRSGESPLDRRWALAWYAELRTQRGLFPSMVENVSADGAKIRVGSNLIDGEHVTLILPNCTPIEARIAWHRREHIGVQFLTRQSWIIEFVLRMTETEEWFPITVA